MKAILTVLAMMAAAGVQAAFDSEAWLAKREALRDEALRLKAAYSNCVARLATPAENVSVPLDTFADGTVKSSVFAKKAVYFLNEGLIWAEDVVAKKFKRDGELDMTVEAKNCVVDRFAKAGWAEGPAKITQRGTVFSGRGVYFSSPEAYVKVFEDSDLRSSDLKFGGLRQ